MMSNLSKAANVGMNFQRTRRFEPFMLFLDRDLRYIK